MFYSWPCLFEWIQVNKNFQICPICKTGISNDTIVPVFNCGCHDLINSTSKVPPRPKAKNHVSKCKNFFLKVLGTLKVIRIDFLTYRLYYFT